MHFRVMAAPGDGQGEREAVVAASALCTVGDLKDMACRAMGIEEPQQWAIWDYAGQKAGANLELSLHKTLPGAKLADHQALLLAPKPPKQDASSATTPAAAPLPVPGAQPGTPPSPTLLLPAPGPLPLGSPLRLSSPRFGACSPTSPLARSFDRAPAWAEDVVSESPGRSHGLAGLGNLGNTCFMNSSLQCLAHTPPLMRTFLSEAYRRDLNKDNPLSLGGKLALAFGSLMGKLWQGGVASVSPKLFKWQLAKFAPQFSGYAQQDSQELLAFLLDGLHEDLNRITDKPYIEDKDAEGRPDEEVAAEAWTNYRRRNDSVIVDAFQGLYRSVLTCPNCNFHSVKFDPFMYLSLPLPSSKMRAITFTAVHMDGSAPPCRYGIELPRSATVEQLYAGMAELVGLPGGGPPEDRLLLTQFNLSSGDSAVYSDLKARVSGIEDLRTGRFSIHRTPPHYVLFVYPSAEQGPRAPGTRPVLVYHKTKGYSSQPYVIPATPLFVPGGAELAAELACSEEGGGGDTLVAHPRVQAQLRALLRPCRKHPEQEEEEAPAPAAPDAADGPSSGSPVAMDTAPASEGAAAGPAASAAGEGEGEAMEVEQAQQAQQQQQQQQDGQQQQAQDRQQDQPQEQQQQDGGTFDMWAPQKEDARKAAEAAAAATTSQPPYLLKLAKKSSYGSGVNTYGIKASDVLKDGQEEEPLVLLAEWQSAAEQLYDPKPLLSAEQHASAAALAERQRDGGKSVGLADCLETFLQPEQLDADDCWYCSKCKAHVQADKKLDLWSLPDVLVIHLKRFSYSRYSRDKLDTLVDFPLTGLDMGPYLLPQSGNGGSGGSSGVPIYDCFAVSNHYGGMGGGHYTAYCRVPGTAAAAGEEGDLGHWYTFDDSHVGKMEASGVRTAAAYVLFYRRRGSCAVDVDALLAQRAAAQRSALDVGAGHSGQQQQQQQQAAAGPAGAASPAADTSMLDSQEALEAASQEAAAARGQTPPPPPLPGSSGSLGSMLGKRQPDTIDEELEEDSKDELEPAAGGMPIDLD